MLGENILGLQNRFLARTGPEVGQIKRVILEQLFALGMNSS